MAVGRLKHAAAVRYEREEFLGGEDLVEQFPAPFMDPGVPPFFVNPRRQIEEASMIPLCRGCGMPLFLSRFPEDHSGRATSAPRARR